MRSNSKKERSYSVIIVSDALATSKDFVVTHRSIRRAIVAFSVLLLIFGFMIYDYLTISFDTQRIKRLETENSEKDNRIETLASQIESLSVNLEQMETFKRKILVATGLTSPMALTEVGSGGSIESPMGGGQVIPSQPGNQVPVTPTGINPSDRFGSLEQITGNAVKITETLQFVDSYLDKQKIRLASTPTIWPVHGLLTDSFGSRIHPLTGKPDNHSGQDIATQLGSPVLATADGFVLMTERNRYLGNLVVIDHGFGFITRYGHLVDFNVKEGQQVKRRDVIGFVGSTGSSTAPHLHYEVIVYNKPQNPMDFILD
jgi:murein DD-endopeptidase MepM/ murein hydrolase activator NlpD